MLFIFIIILAFFIFIALKNNRDFSVRFILLLIGGWILIVPGFMLFAVQHNYYHNVAIRYLNLNDDMWRTIAALNFSFEIIICLINLGSLIIVYAILCFSISFSHPTHDKRKNKIYIALAISPILQFFIFDPYLYLKLYLALFGSTFVTQNFLVIRELVYRITYVVNMGYILFAIINMILYLKKPKIRIIRLYSTYITIGFVSFIMMYLYMFMWAPRFMLNVSTVLNYQYYMPIMIMNNYILCYIFPFISIAAAVIIVYSICKYNSIENFYYNRQVHFSRDLDMAYLGVRAITHSVKNQLICIEEEAALLKQEIGKYPEISEGVNTIHQMSNDVLKRINELSYKFKKIRLDLKLESLDILMKESIKSIDKLPDNITIRTEVCEDIPQSFIDINILKDCLGNIIRNAVEAMSGISGIIAVRIETEKQWGIISVIDSGVGIEKDALDNIFEPFYTTKLTNKNWGVGLSFCYKIVSAHDGIMQVESTPGKGSIFKILLPKC